MANRAGEKHLRWLHWGSNALGAAVALIILFGAQKAHDFMRREAMSLDQQLQDDLSRMSRADELRSQRELAARTLQSLYNQLDDLKNRIPATPNEAEFLAQLSELAERSAVRLKNFRPGQIAGVGAIETFDVQLSLVGPFA